MNKPELKEMVYKDYPISSEHPPEILGHDTYDGYEWFILSMHTHPCAYIVLDKNNPFYGMDYEVLNNIMSCHGGFTYSENHLGTTQKFVKEDEEKWVIGWDYAHADDYHGCLSHLEPLSDEESPYGYKWTTQEIYDEIWGVINDLKLLKMIGSDE